MSLAATKPILCQGKQYAPGDVLPDDLAPNLKRQLVDHNFAHETDRGPTRPAGSGRGKAETNAAKPRSPRAKTAK